MCLPGQVMSHTSPDSTVSFAARCSKQMLWLDRHMPTRLKLEVIQDSGGNPRAHVPISPTPSFAHRTRTHVCIYPYAGTVN